MHDPRRRDARRQRGAGDRPGPFRARRESLAAWRCATRGASVGLHDRTARRARTPHRGARPRADRLRRLGREHQPLDAWRELREPIPRLRPERAARRELPDPAARQLAPRGPARTRDRTAPRSRRTFRPRSTRTRTRPCCDPRGRSRTTGVWLEFVEGAKAVIAEIPGRGEPVLVRLRPRDRGRGERRLPGEGDRRDRDLRHRVASGLGCDALAQRRTGGDRVLRDRPERHRAADRPPSRASQRDAHPSGTRAPAGRSQPGGFRLADLRGEPRRDPRPARCRSRTRC